METSDYYLVVERMIRNGELSIDQLPDLLSSLEEQGHIDDAEHKKLLLLAKELDIDQT